MLIGYARISTQDQKLDLQQDALISAGCERVFNDIASGNKSNRAGLEEAINFARKGDILVVWKLDRLGRSIKHLIETINTLSKHDIGFRSLQENIDTTTSGGRLIFHIFGALAEFERNIICERTKAGLTAARARGKKGGRPQVMDNMKITMARALYQNKLHSIPEICNTLSVSRATLYKYLKMKNKDLQVDTT